MKIRTSLAVVLIATVFCARYSYSADAAWKEKIESALERQVTFDFSDTSFGEAISFFQQIARVNLLVDPDIAESSPANITISGKSVTLRNAVDKICGELKLEWILVDQAVFIFPKGKYTQKAAAPATWSDEAAAALKQALPGLSSPEFEVREKASASIKALGTGVIPHLQQALKTETDAEARERMMTIMKSFETVSLSESTPELDKALEKYGRKVTFEFVDTPLEDAANFIKQLTKLPVTCDKDVMKRPLTLRVSDMEVSVALKWIARLGRARLVPDGEGIKFTGAATGEKK